MEKVLNLEERLLEKKQKEQGRLFRRRLDTVRRIVQCSCCELRCAMCGHPVETSEGTCTLNALFADFPLCGGCRTELDDFLKRQQTIEGPELFWHNQQWMDMWEAWIRFREALGRFRGSKEIRLMMRDT